VANFDYNPITGQLDLVGSGGGSSYIDGVVADSSLLPVTLGTPALDSVYLAKAGSGVWLINRKPAGLYCRTANNGDAADWTYLGAFPEVNADGNWALYNSADATKELKFDVSGVSASTVRTLTVPDKNITIADNADIPTTAGDIGAVADTDARLSDTRTPTSHAASHLPEGADELFDQSLNEADDVTFGSVDLGGNNAVVISESGLLVNGQLAWSPEDYGFLGLDEEFVFFWGTGLEVRSAISFTGEDAATNAATTRTNLGLGDSATADIGTGAGEVAAGDHTHELTDLAATGIAAGKILAADGDDGAEWIDAPSGGAGTKTYAVFTPDNNQPTATDFATLDTRNSIAVLDFDDAATESAVFVGILPEAADVSSGLIVSLRWMATTATSGDVRWSIAWEKSNTDLDSDSFDTATAATATANGTSGIVTVTNITCTTIDSLAAGDLFRLRVQRVGGDGADTMTGDAELVAVEVRSAA
jgi:hypothetical protein